MLTGRAGQVGTHIEASLFHQQLGVHQVHVCLIGSVFQEADTDRRAQAAPGILQGCSCDRKKPPEGHVYGATQEGQETTGI